tara:strand:+ start:765 stop:1655 length:891 start_codon:yes stop_codon:yes gene_type:complete
MNYPQHYSPDKENVIKDLLLELQTSGRISSDSEQSALLKLGIEDQSELWQLIEEKRKRDIIRKDSVKNVPEIRDSFIQVNNPPGFGRSGTIDQYANPVNGLREEKQSDSQRQKIPQNLFMLGTPWWCFQKKLPQGAYEWALSLQTSFPNTDEKSSSRRGGFQSISSSDFNQIPTQCIQHIQYIFKDFPRFKFTNWWVNIHNKGDYNITHVHPGSDLTVIWYLTDNNSSLTIHNPMSYSRSNLNMVLPDICADSISIPAKEGDFIVFPGDVLHSIDQHKLDTPRISLSLNMNFEDKS